MTIKKIILKLDFYKALIEELERSDNPHIWINALKINIDEFKQQLLNELEDKDLE